MACFVLIHGLRRPKTLFGCDKVFKEARIDRRTMVIQRAEMAMMVLGKPSHIGTRIWPFAQKPGGERTSVPEGKRWAESLGHCGMGVRFTDHILWIARQHARAP